ncbi:Chlororespiratory reduction 42 [Quillaja saponaria]|uniref:Chlororespiratory reduction 42 n=1 Tax=Quillaja saponaria TaxID=32244 RepID=A0AAD7PR31_QUISA|nr:Chlororespiratory reduction 42 [Quillaja saponaria]
MALSLSSTTTKPFSKLHHRIPALQFNNFNSQILKQRVFTMKSEAKETQAETGGLPAKPSKLVIGSPIIVTEAPKMIKTAASVPCLRVNSGLVKPGDVGRIVSRKPKDVWAVRLNIGTYLIDGKYFKPLELNE